MSGGSIIVSAKYLGGLPVVALPGGDLAAKQSRGVSAGAVPALCAGPAGYPETARAATAKLSVSPARAIERGVNALLASSCGGCLTRPPRFRCAPASLSWRGRGRLRALEALASQCFQR